MTRPGEEQSECPALSSRCVDEQIHQGPQDCRFRRTVALLLSPKLLNNFQSEWGAQVDAASHQLASGLDVERFQEQVGVGLEGKGADRILTEQRLS